MGLDNIFDKIQVKVGHYHGKDIAIVRHIIKDSNGIKKWGLSREGDWILVEEGEEYPDICLLEVFDYRKAKDDVEFVNYAPDWQVTPLREGDELWD